MKKNIIFILVFLMFLLCSCGIIPEFQEKKYTDGLEEKDDIDSMVTDIPPSNAFLESSNIVGIDIVDYPNPYAISEYRKLNEDQKIAFDALSAAIKDILENGPVGNKEYSLSKRISFFDYQLAYNILCANFTAVNGFMTNITSVDSMGSHDYVDSIFLFDDDRLEKYYQQYLVITKEADLILSNIEHDGTAEGKAYSIAEWIVDNFSYAYDYDTRLTEDFSSVYSSFINKEAICSGYTASYDFLCKKAGLETIYVASRQIGLEWHAWNMICINGEWYHIDTTWMTPNNILSYFMISDEICYTNHYPAEYYVIPHNLEVVIPEASHNSLYGSTCFSNASDAWEYLCNNIIDCNKPLRFYFDDMHEKKIFIEHNNYYIENLHCFISIDEWSDFVIIYFY